MARVFISRDLPFPALDRLKEQHEVDVWEERTPPPPDAFLARAQEADALLLTVTEKVDGDFLDQAPSVKAIANCAVGTDNIDLDAAKQRDIPVGNTPGVLTDATADIAFALLLGIARRISEGEREVREGRWAPWHPSHLLGGDLADQTLGIIGWGRIGQAMARRGEGFGMQIVHSSRSLRHQPRRAAGDQRLRLAAHAAHAGDPAPDGRGPVRPDETHRVLHQHEPRRDRRPGRAPRSARQRGDRRRRPRRDRPRAAPAWTTRC